MSRTTKHDKLVAELASRGAETRQFRERLFNAVGRACEEGDTPACTEPCGYCSVEDPCPAERGPRFLWMWAIPDAFIIADRLVRVYEVEVTNAISDEKMDLYSELWFALDAGEVDMELVVVNSHGHETAVDLCAHWYAKLVRNTSAITQAMRAGDR